MRVYANLLSVEAITISVVKENIVMRSWIHNYRRGTTGEGDVCV